MQKNNLSDSKDLNRVAQAIYDKKGFNIVVIDVRGVCTMTDYFIIAEGSVDRHVKALGHTITDEFSKEGRHPLHVEGQQEGDWVVLDYGDFVVHLFIPELRMRYALDELWREGKLIDIQYDTSRPESKNRDAFKE